MSICADERMRRTVHHLGRSKVGPDESLPANHHVLGGLASTTGKPDYNNGTECYRVLLLTQKRETSNVQE